MVLAGLGTCEVSKALTEFKFLVTHRENAATVAEIKYRICCLPRGGDIRGAKAKSLSRIQGFSPVPTRTMLNDHKQDAKPL